MHSALCTAHVVNIGIDYRDISARRHNALPHSAKLPMRKTVKSRCFPGQVHHARPQSHSSGYINALYLVLEWNENMGLLASIWHQSCCAFMILMCHIIMIRFSFTADEWSSRSLLIISVLKRLRCVFLSIHLRSRRALWERSQLTHQMRHVKMKTETYPVVRLHVLWRRLLTRFHFKKIRTMFEF